MAGYLVGQYLYLTWALAHSTLKMGTELVLEMSMHFNTLTRLLAQESFVEFSRHESIKTYIINL
jgi:hypothetical protein